MSKPPVSLTSLEHADDFVGRHIGPSDAEISRMLAALGLASLHELVEKTIPAQLLTKSASQLRSSRSEREVLAHARTLAAKNRVCKSFLGLGYSPTFTPPVILRNILENPGWYTAYTPYQAEISQGRLEALLNFQTMIMDLTGMAFANASLLDEATAAAEAMAMAHSLSENGSARFWVARDCHPQTIEVLRTRAKPLGIEIVLGDPREASFEPPCFGIILQSPSSDGRVFDYTDLVSRARKSGAIVTVATDLLGLALLKPPGEFAADIVVGSSQRFGVPMGFGGPHAAFFACREEFKRKAPGRVIGLSIDADGKPGLRLSLQTREQHIRREKATSNICTAQVLLAVMASMYALYHGPEGIERIARRTHRLTAILARGLTDMGIPPRHASFFDTLAVPVPSADVVLARGWQAGCNLRKIDNNTVGISLSEMTVLDEIETLLRIVSGKESTGVSLSNVAQQTSDTIPAALARTTPILQHPIFRQHHSETDMLRYLFKLQGKDLSLTSSMIPLGSCTMKLNATSEMIPVTWPEFANLHPFAPLEQAQGYLELFKELDQALRDITGFSAVSLQPNAGSQGEYAGLLVIRRYHESRGEGQRNVCLIPSSAHGTNPASAAMAGMKVVVVACDRAGNVDLEDLATKAREHRAALAALMVTYPSTHGVFEEGIKKICAIVHEHGGQVYMDGANMNALVGLCRPAELGADVLHLNLHKTFCIPHGGGGPGMGPIGVQSHLAPYLPGHSLRPECAPKTATSAVSAAPWGSAAILPISWAYILMMGGDGLKKATQVAILNANYLAHRLSAHYPVLFRGMNGMVAHECILDCRQFKGTSAVEAEDIAKRLMDFGFHAPTMSFPVPGTLMIEPTESESKAELDRFCDAMIAIRAEITAIEEKRFPQEDNPLKNAPHTQTRVMASEWKHPYSREQAAFPLPWLRENKYWPTVARIDNAYGDRNFVCSCPPIESYA